MLILALFWGCFAAPVSADPGRAGLDGILSRGHASYYQGNYTKALGAYEETIHASSMTLGPWLNGAVVLEETGQLKKAMQWYRKAAAISADPAVLSALGWAQWRAKDLAEATTTFQRVLRREPHNAYALLGAARVELDSQRPEQALKFLEAASEAAPLVTLIPYYQGKAYEALGDYDQAADAYRQAVVADSYFAEGRDALGRAQLRRRRYNEAWRQFSKLLDSEPHSQRIQALLRKVQPLLTRRPAEIRPTGLHQPLPYLAESPAGGPRVPLIRVGIGTNSYGKPRARQTVAFQATSDFDVVDAATGKKLIEGSDDETWRAAVKRVKKRRLILVTNPAGKTILKRAQAIAIRPQAQADGVIALDDGRTLRGKLEISVYKGNLRLVNVLDLENYTQGVVAAEMPVKSPLEALKAQAVVARSHALFIKKVTRRHRREGYDVCDGEHCQVYAGVRAESKRSREVVEATRGRIVTYRGSVAHVIYSSNCGGFTQSGKDLVGWGDVPYWTGIADGNDLGPRPASPWELRQWLASWPQAYCKPSNDVHPSHFRWNRVIAAKDLEAKINRRLKIGRLRGLRPLRRSPTGNVNKLLIIGTRRNAKIDSEIQIRGLLGLGSLRSTLFVVETEYDPKGHPETFVFHGGGWGHGVGLCQSGAMGRADAGQNYEEIIKAYFKGTELSQLKY